MYRLSRRFVVLAVLVIGLLAMPPAASAQTTGLYLQVNNGTIVTNPGQEPQVVLQFGNLGSEPEFDVDVFCFVLDHSLGFITQAYPGPFAKGLVASNAVDDGYISAAYFVEEGSLSVGLEDAIYIGFSRGLTINPGQNYNVAFNVRITAPSGSTGRIACSGEASTLPGAIITVRVQ